MRWSTPWGEAMVLDGGFGSHLVMPISRRDQLAVMAIAIAGTSEGDNAVVSL